MPHFKKFISASASGRRHQPSGKKISGNTVEQYIMVSKLIDEFEHSVGKQRYIRWSNQKVLGDTADKFKEINDQLKTTGKDTTISAASPRS